MHQSSRLIVYITFGFGTYHYYRRKGNSNRPVTSISLAPRNAQLDHNGFRDHNDQVAIGIRHT